MLFFIIRTTLENYENTTKNLENYKIDCKYYKNTTVPHFSGISLLFYQICVDFVDAVDCRVDLKCSQTLRALKK